MHGIVRVTVCAVMSRGRPSLRLVVSVKDEDGASNRTKFKHSPTALCPDFPSKRWFHCENADVSAPDITSRHPSGYDQRPYDPDRHTPMTLQHDEHVYQDETLLLFLQFSQNFKLCKNQDDNPKHHIFKLSKKHANSEMLHLPLMFTTHTTIKHYGATTD